MYKDNKDLFFLILRILRASQKNLEKLVDIFSISQ